MPAGRARYAGSVTDPTRASSSLEGVYTPFPSFAEWMTSFDVDVELFDSFAARLTAAKESSTPESMTRAIDIATKWAAIDTGAIEGLYDVDRGFTFSVAAQAAAWDNIHIAKDDYTERAIKDALEAYEFVLDAATQILPVTEVLIKRIHEIICASQDEFTVITAVGPQKQEMPKGEYKRHANSPFNIATETVHAYASVLDTPPEMTRLVGELNSNAFAEAHPVAQASYAHYAFVCIHPFADGNGRVSRALASIYLYRAPGVPLVIFADQKNIYIDALEAADRGNPAAFQRFVADRVIDTVQSVVVEAQHSNTPDVVSRLSAFQGVIKGLGGLTHANADDVGLRLLDDLAAEVQQAATTVDADPNLNVEIDTSGGYGGKSAPPGYRMINARSSLEFIVSSVGPGTASDRTIFRVAARLPQTTGPDYVLMDDIGRVRLEAFVRDLWPSTSASMHYRLMATAESIVATVVDEVVAKTEFNLRKGGYLS